MPPKSREKISVEVCVDSLEAARFAQAAGADRLELNLALELDGLTPSAGLLQRVCEESEIPVIAMARPRAGDFFYSHFEWSTLLADVDYLIKHGAAGVAFGCLDENGNVDVDRCRQVQAVASGKATVFHKAFDAAANPAQALETLIGLGIDRVMTSGRQASSLDGAEMISQLVGQANGRIEILPAGGVNSQNAEAIVRQTGVNQVHGSFSRSGGDRLFEEVQATIGKLASVSVDPKP